MTPAPLKSIMEQIIANRERWSELKRKFQPLHNATFVVPREHLEHLERIPTKDPPPLTSHAIRV
jgi:hypothetical protein